MSGQRTYTLPGTDDVEVEVNYKISDGEVVFDGAYINGRAIDCDLLSYQPRYRAQTIPTLPPKKQTLRQYFQDRLDDDADDIADDEMNAVGDARADERRADRD